MQSPKFTPKFIENGVHQSVIVSDQPCYPISAQGFENSVDVTQSPGVIVQLDGAGNGAQIRDSPEAMAFLHGTDNAVRLIGNAGVLALAARDDTVTVRGTHNTVSLVGATPGTIVTDRGLATTIVVDSTELTIQDFRADPLGKVDLHELGVTPAHAVAAERPDGHGGTLLSLSNNGAIPGFPTTTLDFLGERHVGLVHFA